MKNLRINFVPISIVLLQLSFLFATDPRIKSLSVNDNHTSAPSIYTPAKVLENSQRQMARSQKPGISLRFTETTVLSPFLDDFQVNENWGGGHQDESALVMGNNNQLILVWRDLRNGSADIYARCHKNDIPIGPEFKVNDSKGHWPDEPTVAINSNGDWIVAWVEDDFNIYGQYYQHDEIPRGNNFKVTDAIGTYPHHDPTVAFTKKGDFVIVWRDTREGGYNIYGQYYSSDGTSIGDNFKLNEVKSTSSLSIPSLAMNSLEVFMVVWADKRNKNHDIYGQLLANDGTKISTNFKINDDTGSSEQTYPIVTPGTNGNFIIIWQDNRNGQTNIYAQQIKSDGTYDGSNFKVNKDPLTKFQTQLTYMADLQAHFILIWADSRNGKKNNDIYGQIFSRNTTAPGAQFKINDDTGIHDQRNPQITVDINGNFCISWLDNREGNFDVFAQQYVSNGSPHNTNFKVNSDQNSSFQGYPAIAVDSSGQFMIVWVDERMGNLDVYSQRFQLDGTLKGINFNVTDDTSFSHQDFPDVGMAATGDFVIVWDDYRSGYPLVDIYAQCYHADGMPIGNNFKINDDAGFGVQGFAQIAVDGQGNFVVTWLDDRNGNFDIYRQRFLKDGTPVGGNHKVNDDQTSSYQESPAIDMNDSGYFAIVWRDHRNGDQNPDIYGQLYKPDGLPIGKNFRANSDTTITGQYQPVVILMNNGDLIVVWLDDRNGNENPDIFMRHFYRTGIPKGDEFKVNDDLENCAQYEPAIAIDNDGNSVVVWSDERNPAYESDIYAQQYDAMGKPIGTNYRVNNGNGEGIQEFPDVKFNRGKIYYTWMDNRIAGQGYDIFTRIDQFASSGIESGSNSAPIASSFYLLQNYPNPFNPNTAIEFALPKSAFVTLKVYNLLGEEVNTLVAEERSAGMHKISWDARKLASGVYVYRLEAGDFIQYKKLILMR